MKVQGKMERCNRTMMTKKEQRKKIVTNSNLIDINFTFFFYLYNKIIIKVMNFQKNIPRA